jgi:hypothetical protein
MPLKKNGEEMLIIIYNVVMEIMMMELLFQMLILIRVNAILYIEIG